MGLLGVASCHLSVCHASVGLQSYWADFEYLHELCKLGLFLESYTILFFLLNFRHNFMKLGMNDMMAR